VVAEKEKRPTLHDDCNCLEPPSKSICFRDVTLETANWTIFLSGTTFPDMAIKVAVTEPEYQKAKAVFSAAIQEGYQCVPSPSDETELAAMLRQQRIRYAIIGVASYCGLLYEALGSMGVIARFGVGHDGVDKAKATQHEVLCTNTPGVLDDSVAEFTIGLLLALSRRTAAQSIEMLAGEWSPGMGIELKAKRLAVIGCGGIGRRVGRIAAHGFGMEVVGFKRSVAESQVLRNEFGFQDIVTDFGEAVGRALFVSLHLPGAPETRHFLNRSRLELIPAGSFLINTARGSLVDESALYDVLATGRLEGAALDVFEREPYEPQVPGRDLRHLSNVIMTPHIGGSTREACDRMATSALRNIQLAVKGEYSEMNILNRDVLVRIRAHQLTP
jgi:D-3-phosphoglycerate dehydrogenase